MFVLRCVCLVDENEIIAHFDRVCSAQFDRAFNTQQAEQVLVYSYAGQPATRVRCTSAGALSRTSCPCLHSRQACWSCFSSNKCSQKIHSREGRERLPTSVSTAVLRCRKVVDNSRARPCLPVCVGPLEGATDQRVRASTRKAHYSPSRFRRKCCSAGFVRRSLLS